jgi:prepilin peptidase CpaA
VASAAAFIIWIGVIAAAALSDIRTMTIPNRLSLLLLGAFAPLYVAAGGTMDGLAAHAATGAIVFAICLGLFVAGWFGGGDAKLLPAMALWVGPAGLAHLVLGAALAGGVVALVLPLLRRLAPAGAPERWGMTSLRSDEGVPYAVALGAGGLLALQPVVWFDLSHLSALLTFL